MLTKLTVRSSIPAVLAELTTDEKLRLLRAETAIHSTALPDHDIPSMVLTDGVTGINFAQLTLDFKDTLEDSSMLMADGGISMLAYGAMPMEEIETAFADDPAMTGYMEAIRVSRHKGKQYICFPSGINIGATWNTEQAYAIGQAVGWEMRDSGVDVCLGPNVDIMRDPLGGRNYEMYGEDPILVGQIGAAFIRGLQSTGVGACAKHLLANNQESRRNSVDTHVSKRTLMELYCAGFKAAVCDGGVMAMMSSLNSVNGEFSSYSHKLLTELTRDDWGFDGVIVSDWGAATANPDHAISAGLDLILPGKVDMSACDQALADGTLSMCAVDTAVTRILEMICDLKALQSAVPAIYDRPALESANRQTVMDGAVLLKNDGVLPLSDQCITFWGDRSKNLIQCGTGSTQVLTALNSNPYDALVALGAKVQFENWDGADVLVYTASAGAGEGADRSEMDLEIDARTELPQILREAKQRGLKTVVLLNIPGPVDMTSWIKNADAVLCLFIPGSEGGNAAAELLLGRAEPAGRLPVTFPLHYYDTPAYPNFPGEHDDVYCGEGIFVGYRHYDIRHLPVAFPFGHGMSYTTFEQHLLTRRIEFDLTTQEKTEILVEIKNTGKCTGSQVIQLYVSEINPRLRRPEKELCAFGRVTLKPNETKTLKLVLRAQDLARFDESLDNWVTPLGAYRLLVGTSSEAIFDELSMNVQGKNPYVLGPQSQLDEILDNEAAVQTLVKYFPDAREKLPLLRYLSGMTLEALLTSQMIQTEPDANKVTATLKSLYEELAALS